MTFANKVNNELRATFGPKWISNAVTWVVVLGALVVLGAVVSETLELANGLSSKIENMEVK